MVLVFEHKKGWQVEVLLSEIKRDEMSIAKLISQRGSSQKPTQARGEGCPGAKCDVTSSHLLTLRRR